MSEFFTGFTYGPPLGEDAKGRIKSFIYKSFIYKSLIYDLRACLKNER